MAGGGEDTSLCFFLFVFSDCFYGDLGSGEEEKVGGLAKTCSGRESQG